MEIRFDVAIGIIFAAIFLAALGAIVITGFRSGKSRDEIINKLITTINNVDASSIEKIRIAGELIPPAIVDGTIKVGEVAKLVTDDELDQLITAVERLIIKVTSPVTQPEIERIAQAIVDTPTMPPVDPASLSPDAATYADLPPVG